MKDTIARPQALYDRFERKPGPDKQATHYCPGCGHGNLHKFIAETLDELGVRERTIFVSPVGCSVFGYYYFNCGNIQAPHGRAPAVATAVKRAHPDSVVICYQGDGDLASIGGNQILQAANRGENFTVIFVNNALYGMTGGQMAPTTLVGQRTTTSPRGRSVENEGYPMKMAELLAQLEAPVYIERCHLDESSHVLKTRGAIRKAIQAQLDGKGFSMVEVASPCPTGWGMDPLAAREWITSEMARVFPAHVACDRRKERAARSNSRFEANATSLREALGLAGDSLCAHATADPRTLRMIFAGFGGQGVLSLGMLVAKTGMLEGRKVSWLPSYGPEMRGGTANCSVVLSPQRIGSPLVSTPDVLVAFNEPSLEKFGPLVVPGGTILYDDSFVSQPWDRPDVNVVRVPFSTMAHELGTARVTNMVAFGALHRLLGLFSPELIRGQIRGLGKRELIDMNLNAFEAGAAAVAKEEVGVT